MLESFLDIIQKRAYDFGMAADDPIETGTGRAARGGRPAAMSRSDWATQIRACGLRVTTQRLAVMAAVDARPHCSADEVSDDVRAELGSVSRQAVYDALGTLVDHGLLRRIQPAGAAAWYETRVGDNHHHVVCRGCRRVADVDCAVGDVPCLTAAESHGFDIDEAEVIYWGRCPDCREAPD